MIFKEKTGKFGSLIGIVAVLAMLALFFASFPRMLLSVSGWLFAAIWAFMAIMAFTAHARRLSVKSPHTKFSDISEKGNWTKRQINRRYLKG